MQMEELYKLFLQYPSVNTDTRKIKPGDLYFALKGEQFNGNVFVNQALEKGAAFAIIDEAEFNVEGKTILVENVLHTLQCLALFHRSQFSIPFLAITGSNGKTTTKELLHTVLSAQYITYATEGNLNNHIGIPLTLLKIKNDAQMAIIEMGANHQKEIEAYCAIVKPTHGLINNCGKAHLEGFGGIDGVRKGKGELYDYLREQKGVIFRNADLDYLETMARGIENQITYGSQEADYQGIATSQGMFVGASVITPKEECSIRTQLVGAYNFHNIMAAFAVGRTFHLPVETIRDAIQNYTPDNSRSQLIKSGSNTIILDAYNANPSSMTEAITNFSLADYANKVVMIGGMKELGAESIYEHQQIIFLLQQTNWNKVVLVGDDFSKVEHPYLYFKDSSVAKDWFEQQHFEHTAILIKGSRAFAMEKVIGK